MSDFFTFIKTVLGWLFAWQIWGISIGYLILGIVLLGLVLKFVRGKRE